MIITVLKKIILLLSVLSIFSFAAPSEDENYVSGLLAEYLKSSELKQEYTETAIGQMYSVMVQKGKTFDSSMTASEINERLYSVIGNNFDQIKAEVKDSKVNKAGEIELSVNLEGKDIFNPIETTVISSTSQRTIDSDKFIKDFTRYMRMYSAGKKRIKVVYSIGEDGWQLSEDESMKLLTALLVIKYF